MRASRWWTLAVVCVGSFILLLDVTIVNVALPDIEAALDADFDDLQWVIAAYSVALSAVLLTAGSLADRFGRRKIFAAGVVVFTVGSLLCGVASSAAMLNGARGLQGVGGAALLATSLALLAHAFPAGAERHRALAVWGAVSGSALAVGPLAGGAIVEAVGWRWIFLVNLPVGVVAFVATLAKVAESRDADAGRVDVLGFLTFGTALGSVTYALLRGNEAGWSSRPIVVAFAVSATALVSFVLVESRLRRPMLPASLLADVTTVGAALAVFAMAATAFAMLLYLTLYLQTVLRFDPLDAGLRLLPLTISIFLASAVGGRLAAAVSPRLLVSAGLAAIGGGLALMSGLSASDGWTALLAGQVVTGLGVGLVNPTVVNLALDSAPPGRSGLASGFNNTCRSFGIAVGVAALGVIFSKRVETSVADTVAGTALGPRAADLSEAIASGKVDVAASTVTGPDRGAVYDAAALAFVDAFNQVLVVAAVVAAVAAIVVLPLVRARDLVPSHVQHLDPGLDPDLEPPGGHAETVPATASGSSTPSLPPSQPPPPSPSPTATATAGRDTTGQTASDTP